MKKLLAIVIAMAFVFGVVGTSIAQPVVVHSNVVTNPLQDNTAAQAGQILTGPATGGSGNWAVAANVPITLVGGSSGSTDYDGQSFNSNSTNVTNGKMCATANGGGNANTGNNTLNQTVKQKNVIKQKTKELENN